MPVSTSETRGLPVDPVCRGWEWDDVRAVIGSAQAHVVPLVVVPDVLRQGRVRVSFALDKEDRVTSASVLSH